jgi:hypothetical protein
MKQLILLARSKIPDLAALTAARTLRDALDLPVTAVDREILWTLSHDQTEQGEQLAARLIRTTTLLVNPSKQRVRSGALLPPALSGPQGTRPWRIEVWEEGEGARVLQRMQAAHAFTAIREIRRSLLWTLHIPATADAAQVLDRALVVTRRDHGLLVNPHYQSHRVIDAA